MPLKRPYVITGALAVAGAAVCGCVYFFLHRRVLNREAEQNSRETRLTRYEKLLELRRKLVSRVSSLAE